MARADYIYVIEQYDQIVAGFTVRHEMVKYLKAELFDDVRDNEGVLVYRIVDNPIASRTTDGGKVFYTKAELLRLMSPEGANHDH